MLIGLLQYQRAFGTQGIDGMESAAGPGINGSFGGEMGELRI